jgi:hypothetical protein
MDARSERTLRPDIGGTSIARERKALGIELRIVANEKGHNTINVSTLKCGTRSQEARNHPNSLPNFKPEKRPHGKVRDLPQAAVLLKPVFMIIGISDVASIQM